MQVENSVKGGLALMGLILLQSLLSVSPLPIHAVVVVSCRDPWVCTYHHALNAFNAACNRGLQLGTCTCACGAGRACCTAVVACSGLGQHSSCAVRSACSLY